MLSSLLRPRKTRRALQQLSSSPNPDEATPMLRRDDQHIQHASADWTETEDNEEYTMEERDDDDEHSDNRGQGHDGALDDEDEDGGEEAPLLPIFSAVHLGIYSRTASLEQGLIFTDALPVYNLTHTIRTIVSRCETTLSWDQLRSPQVSQFLIKPMQQQIRTEHLSRATLYALMANSLQFGKESQLSLKNAGNQETQAMICQLLAIKLLKEYNTRELIDALSYDFFPLQGCQTSNLERSSGGSKQSASRVSTLEVAIRAQAKQFLAHPLVVQQLEAIWAGTIVFHSHADYLHRPPNARPRGSHGYGTTPGTPNRRTSTQSSPGELNSANLLPRRSVTLYDPRDASLFKLSRLRVPRYRQFFSTLSLAILLYLFVAVLSQSSVEITTIEIVFWLWSAGFMLDEIVGFNEQGFSLYVMSFWNIFDLAILLFLVIYYTMRVYGILLPHHGQSNWNSMSYDVLAASAVLLFPRLFSVLDHSRYFSQLLIAFRLMAVDLAAVLVLILISCSGFLVAFTLAFGTRDYDASQVAYQLFQIWIGFSPAAWDAWEDYNYLGRAILVLFLFISHFLTVTILVSVLSNSFMAIVSNANAEHQFLFAVNTISMVKNDSLFSYMAPSNLLAWLLTPSRYIVPFRVYVKLNRYVIKITHFPLLFGIYIYERGFLAQSVYEPTDLIDHRGRPQTRAVSFWDPAQRAALFSPTIRLRQESVGYQKERALEEVFRLAPRDNNRYNVSSHKRRETSAAVNTWMDQHEGVAGDPPREDQEVLDRLDRKRQAAKKPATRRGQLVRGWSGAKSLGSDLDHGSMKIGARHDFAYFNSEAVPAHAVDEGVPQTEDDGDDEFVTNDEDDTMTIGKSSRKTPSPVPINANLRDVPDNDYFRTPTTSRPLTAIRMLSPPTPSLESPESSKTTPENLSTGLRVPQPDRTISSTTVIYNPLRPAPPLTTSSSPTKSTNANSNSNSTVTPTTVRKMPIPRSKPRPSNSRRQSQVFGQHSLDSIMSGQAPIHDLRHAHTNTHSHTQGMHPRRPRPRRSSSLDLGLMLSLEPQAHNIGAVPSSFGTQMALATGELGRRAGDESALGRLMLVRMKGLEESIRGLAREVKELRDGTVKEGNTEGSAEERAKKGKERGKGRKGRG
jgi:hypothetical protein